MRKRERGKGEGRGMDEGGKNRGLGDKVEGSKEDRIELVGELRS